MRISWTTTMRLFLIALALALCTGCASDQASDGVLYQTSTINALLDGVYDGPATCGEVRSHGDLGLGTFAALDGEMVLLDGRVYQVRSDGSVHPAPDALGTPLAMAVSFHPDQEQRWDARQPIPFEQLQKQLDGMRGSGNVPYAIRIDGTFTAVRTRSVPRQDPPYRKLAEVVKDQSVFDLHECKGTLVGFWFPQYMNTVNVPGYHFHFLRSDHAAGGHVLECQPTSVRVQMQRCSGMDLRWPMTDAFLRAQISQERPAELNKVEK